MKKRALLELALIHPSFRTNYGTNPDHAKNTLNNCGIRLGKDGKGIGSGTVNGHIQQQQCTRKRGINALMEIMAMQGSKKTEHSTLKHNERYS